MPKIILNAAHGGSDAGGIYNKRLEKEDTLILAETVGRILRANNYEVVNLREEDIFLSPVTRVETVNEIGGDLLVSLHRANAPFPNTFSGARVLVDPNNSDEIVYRAGEEVLKKLAFVGYPNNGIGNRWYYILSNSEVPGFVLVVGYINSDYDNELFDDRFYETADAIAQGIMDTFES